MSGTPEPRDALEGIAKLARRSASYAVDDARKRGSRAALLARIENEPRRRSFRSSLRVLVPALAAAAAVALFFAWPRTLSYDVDGARSENGYVSAPSQRAVTLRFSDETEVLAESGARLRVENTSARGARVLVERGRARVQVSHREGAEWTFVAGPFEVEVRGTRFVMSWEPAHEAFDLMLEQGAVNVRGPFGTGPIALSAGQRFRGDGATRSMSVTNGLAVLEKAPAVAPVEAPAPPSAIPPLTPPAASAEAVPADRDALPSTHRTQRPWSQRIVDGEFETIVQEAEARGIASTLAIASSTDLRALSDAARYVGRSDLAEQSLLSLRRRFAGGADGRAAAFMLGRLQEGRGRAAQAKSFYETYLSESPSGNFAAEALAGKMRTVLALSGRAAAQPIARDYLARYPTGVHAKTARGIVGTH
jgi:TolA-binding protein